MSDEIPPTEAVVLNPGWTREICPFHDPPTEEEIKKYFGDALIKKFVELFESVCWNTPQYAHQSLHVITGQLKAVKNMKINYDKNTWDGRFHGCLFQRSGTGKGRGYNFAMTVMDRLGIRPVKGDSVTDARLLGDIFFPEGEDEPIETPGYLDPRSGFDVLVLNEATLVLDAKKTEYSKDFLNYFQIGMNTIGTPDNRIQKSTNAMRGRGIDIQPEISFYFTTYPPTNLLETIVKAGLLQRMNILYNPKTFEERKEDWERLAGNVGKTSELNIDEVVQTLKYIDKYFKERACMIMVTDQAQQISQNVMKRIYSPITEVNSVVRETLADFVPRIYEQVVKVAYHHAILRLSIFVDVCDFNYALAFLMPAWSRLISYLEDSDELVQEETRKWRTLARESFGVYDSILKLKRLREPSSDDFIPLETVVTILNDPATGWDKSKVTIRKRIQKLVALGYYEKKIDEEKKKIYIRKSIDNGR